MTETVTADVARTAAQRYAAFQARADRIRELRGHLRHAEGEDRANLSAQLAQALDANLDDFILYRDSVRKP